LININMQKLQNFKAFFQRNKKQAEAEPHTGPDRRKGPRRTVTKIKTNYTAWHDRRAA